MEKTTDNTSSILWDSFFVFLNLSFFLVFTNVAFLYLYPLALEAMGLKHHMVGLVLGIFSAAAVISRPFFGQLVIRKGEFLVITLGLTINLISSLSYILIHKFGPAMLFIRVCHGLGFSAFICAGFSLAAKTVHPARRGEAFSIIGVSLMGAVAVAPYLGEILIRQWGFTALYISAAGAVSLSWIVAIKAISPLQAFPPNDPKIPVRYFDLLKKRSFIFLLLSTLIFSHCQATVPNFIALISHDHGVPSGRFFLVSNAMAILVLLSTGKLLDHFGKICFMRIFYPVLGMGIFFIPQMIDSPLHPVPALLYGVGVAFLFSTHNALAAGHGTHTEKPAIMSLFTATYDSGFVTGAVISGWVAHVSSIEMLFWSCGIVGCTGLCLALMFPMQKDGVSLEELYKRQDGTNHS